MSEPHVKDDGGPAFPVEVQWTADGLMYGVQTGRATDWHMGMSLRDYFAGQALAGLSSREVYESGVSTVAADCYLLADALIAARQKVTK